MNSHGFGSSKESPTAQMLLRELPKVGIGAIAFDFPAHGSSPVDGTRLRIETCMQDLAAVEAYARTLLPQASVVYFSSSFGAYINMQYLAAGTGAGVKSFFRSAAVNMPELFTDPTEDQKRQLQADGFLMLNDYQRPIRLTQAFLTDLARHDLFQCVRPEGVALEMVHGACDETILLEHAVRFSEQFGIPLTIIPGGDHSLSIPGAPEQVLQLAIRFYQAERSGG